MSVVIMPIEDFVVDGKKLEAEFTQGSSEGLLTLSRFCISLCQLLQGLTSFLLLSPSQPLS